MDWHLSEGFCTTQKVGIGEDKRGTYGGVRVMTHELGHILGCPHDGEQYGRFSSKKCPWNDGYIMTNIQNSSSNMKFSWCCNDAITNLLVTTRRTCLVIKSAVINITYPDGKRKLPGEVLTKDQVCQFSFPGIEDIRFAMDNEIARCYASCYSARLGKTLKTLLPDHSRCNETSTEGIESRHKVCVNGGCRTKRYEYPVEPVARPFQ
ncbi:hypothetical protein MRX96_056361 [Rhipicephalus microplus]